MYYRYGSIEREGTGVCHEGGTHLRQTDELLDKWFPEYTSYIEVIDGIAKLKKGIVMDSWEIWFCVANLVQCMGFAWIYSLFQKRAYKKDIRSRHSYVLLGMLLAKEEKLPYYFSGSREEGIGETYIRLPEGIIKVFSWGVDGFAISLVGAVKVDDMLASKAREFCKELNAKENRVRYSVGFDPIVSETCFMITCNFEEEADGDGEDAAEYDILSYAKTYLVPKQQELQMAWEHRMEELKKEKI